MTLEHSTIPDPYLHEPKGAAAASASTVYVADGAGSGAWTAISGLIPSSTDNFSNKLLQATQHSGQSHVSGWTTKILDTSPTNGISGASVNTSTGVITLPVGTFTVLAYGTSFNQQTTSGVATTCLMRLRDTSSSVTILTSNPTVVTYSPGYLDGATYHATAVSGQAIQCFLGGTFVAASSHTYELQWWGSTTTNSLLTQSSGETPILSNVLIWKIA